MARKLTFAALALIAGLSIASLARAQQGSPIIIFGLGPQLTVSASAVPTSGSAPVTIAFSATPVNGTPPYTYSWDFGDGSALGTGQTPSHTYTSAGNFTAVVTVTDAGHLSAQGPQGITVTPGLSVTSTAMPSSGNAPQTVTFTSTPSGGTSPYTYAWAFGDSGSSTFQNPSHSYMNPGTYSAIVTVTDAVSHTASAAPLTITITGVTTPDLVTHNIFPKYGVPNQANGGPAVVCPTSLDGGASSTGCFMEVFWSMLEPQYRQFDWHTITDQLNATSTQGYPIEVTVQTGKFATPASTAACNQVTTSLSGGCKPWLTDGIHVPAIQGAIVHQSKNKSGVKQQNPTCLDNWFDPYPGDPTYRAELSYFEQQFQTQFGSNSRIKGAMVSVMIASDQGHNLSMTLSDTGCVGNSNNPTGETYGAAWNQIAINNGCASGNESCWAGKLETGLQNLWTDEITNLANMNLGEGIVAPSGFPGIGGNNYGTPANPTGDSAIDAFIWNYITTHKPANAACFVTYEGLYNTPHLNNVAGPYIKGNPLNMNNSQCAGSGEDLTSYTPASPNGTTASCQAWSQQAPTAHVVTLRPWAANASTYSSELVKGKTAMVTGAVNPTCP